MGEKTPRHSNVFAVETKKRNTLISYVRCLHFWVLCCAVMWDLGFFSLSPNNQMYPITSPRFQCTYTTSLFPVSSSDIPRLPLYKSSPSFRPIPKFKNKSNPKNKQRKNKYAYSQCPKIPSPCPALPPSVVQKQETVETDQMKKLCFPLSDLIGFPAGSK
jgi:hypothetical protein